MTETASVRHRMLGGVLRAYRDISGLGLEGAAGILECHPSKISRVENGVRGIRPREVRELLAEYGVSEQERNALAAIARIGAAAGWWQDHADMLTRTDREYLQLEAITHRIEVYEPELVPALLQTSGYAQALAGSVQSGGLAALSQARQRELFGEHEGTGQRGPELAVLIDEAVLYRMVGGPGVMRAQLVDLVRAARGDVPRVTVRVLSFSGGARAVGAGGPVTILRFADAPRAGVVYLARPGPGGTCLVGQDDLTAYVRTLAALTKAALTPARSAELMRDLAATYDKSDTDLTGTSLTQEDDRAGALA